VTQKQENILSAALSLVSEHGFHGTSMAMIAGEARVGAGTIYNYFTSKDELLRALFLQTKREFMDKIMDGVDPEQNMETQFNLFWSNIIHYYMHFPEKVAYLQQFHYSPYFDQACQETTNRLLAPLVAQMETAIQRGEVFACPLPVIESFTLDVAGSLVRRHIKGEIVIDEPLIAYTARMCWSAIKNDDKNIPVPVTM
jgi:AcrR family transcriptional regulator